MPSVDFRGKQYTNKDAVEAMARFDRDRRDGFAAWRTYAIKHDGQEYPPKEILRLMVGDIGHLSGGEPTNHYFRDLGFTVGEIDDVAAAPSSAIEDALDTTFHLESDLERFLAANLSQLERGMKLRLENGTAGRQVDAGDAGRIDILATDAEGILTIIELKAGKPTGRFAGKFRHTWVGLLQSSRAGSL